MLLEFKMSNFKSFKEELIFKMTPTPKIKDLEYSVMKQEISNKEVKILPSAVIYGPNAAGKTNIIGGMEVFKSIVLKGNIRNGDLKTPNVATAKLELIPNINNKKNIPVSFYIKFIEDNKIFEYELTIDLGYFSEKDYQRRILSEVLNMNGKNIYDRKEELEINTIENIAKEYLVEKFSKDVIEMAKSNLDPEELFLSNMFKNAFSKKIYDIIMYWFNHKLNIVYRADALEIFPEKSRNKSESKIYIDNAITAMAQKLGTASSKIAYPVSDDENEIFPLSLIKTHTKEILVLPSETFESLGTIRFFNIFPLIKQTIEKGGVLIVDELDASIHPMVIMNLIKVFHNDEINKKGAQLIFNTHNPIFLNNSLFRRDEIHFVEKNKEIKSSTHYILSDFGTSGDNGVRNTEDYMKNYFINKYGAIEELDFSEFFES